MITFMFKTESVFRLLIFVMVIKVTDPNVAGIHQIQVIHSMTKHRAKVKQKLNSIKQT